jgi:DNA replication protein DnaC
VIPDSWLRARCAPHPSVVGPSQVPRRYRALALDGVQNEKLREKVRQYGRADVFWEVAPQGIGTLFVGVAGTYKTWATAVLAEAIRTQFLLDVAWTNCAEEFEMLDRTKFSAATDARVRELKTAPVCVLDDFMQVAPGGSAFALLQGVINARYDNTMPTLFTANLPADGVREAMLAAFGANVQRRVFEMTEGFRQGVRIPAAAPSAPAARP